MPDCLFCKIVAQALKAEQVGESESFIAIKDIHPKAPVHVLIIPKIHREQPAQLSETERQEIFAFAHDIAKQTGVDKTGYRLVLNVGADSGQEIAHLHLHLIGGRPAGGMY